MKYSYWERKASGLKDLLNYIWTSTSFDHKETGIHQNRKCKYGAVLILFFQL